VAGKIGRLEIEELYWRIQECPMPHMWAMEDAILYNVV
jgi:hypothetical protein